MQSMTGAYNRLGIAILTGLLMSLTVISTLSNTAQASHRSFGSSSFPATFTTTMTYTQYLPIIAQQSLCDISGYATLNGVPTQVVLGLGQFIAWTKTTIYTTTTDSNGRFCFSNVPILPSCDNNFGYDAYFGFGLEVPSKVYAAAWSSPMLPRCQATQIYTDIHAELSDITVLTPPDDITVTLPVTFSWTHPSVGSGSYSIFVGSCSPVNVGSATTYLLWDESCEKPWLPTYWYIMQATDNGMWWYSQGHSLTIQWPR
jgi:hypothetical protein